MERLPKYLQLENGELWLTEKERDNLKISYRIKKVLYTEQSAFQHVMILDSYDFGGMLVLDGVVQTTAMDGHIYNEMITHVPLAMHPHPRHVLIIGGGDLGAAREACKYSKVEHIDLVEIDEAVVRACKQHLPEVSGNLCDPRVRLIYDDGVKFAKNPTRPYDVIIVDSSDPVGPAKQLFELDFYRNLRAALKEDGMLVCQSQSPIFHTEVMEETYGRINRLFPNTSLYTAVVPTYPGGLWSFTLGSSRTYAPGKQGRFAKSSRYINEDVLASCFELPRFIRERLVKKAAPKIS